MRVRKCQATYGAVFFCVIILSLYMMLETLTSSQNNSLVSEKIYNSPRADVDTQVFKDIGRGRMYVKPIGRKQCAMPGSTVNDTHIQMTDVYKDLPFDNPDGGSWKQGWNVSYPQNRWNSTNMLKVFVVPHSHTDPGWLKTYTEYFQANVKRILDNMLIKLEQYPEGRFIYAEMSFFHLWWNGLNDDKKRRVKRLLNEGRLEIATGGWVMNDEANTHYFAMIDQMVEGHQWINGTIGITPSSGWAIDPFGHTPTMAYLLQKSGFDGMVLQRVHYAVKKYLAKAKQLEFIWRQAWDGDGSTDMLAHVMPFYIYDIPHTCGPDPAICCEFDFGRRPIGSIGCPWSSSKVRAVTDSNVAERSERLLDQWKKKAVLFNSTAVLIPLGDDFRYSTGAEWDHQFINYLKMFKHINGHPEYGVQAQFGTLSDYFRTIRTDFNYKRGWKDESYPSSKSSLPTLNGDFFTYADKDDHYWSGYFTSRPFQKNLDRILESHLRGAEILFTIAMTASRRQSIRKFPITTLMDKLINARRNLGVFQHHDGITGTAKDPVVKDYTQRLAISLKDLKLIIKECATLLTLDDKSVYDYSGAFPLYDVDENRAGYGSLPEPTIIAIGEHHGPRPVMFYNSLGHRRKRVVVIFINKPYVVIRDNDGNYVPSQTEPCWTESGETLTTKYKVSFEITVSGIGIAVYTVEWAAGGENTKSTLVTISTSGANPDDVNRNNTIFPAVRQQRQDFMLENHEITTTFDGKTGLMKSILTKEDGSIHRTTVEFVTYGTKLHTGDRSGAYLFLPDGPAKLLGSKGKATYRIIRGPIRSQVLVYLDMLTHVVTLHNSTGIDSLSVDIENIVDIRSQNNFELAVRISTDVNNIDKTFYTDLNGFQMQKRTTYDKLTLQGNVYPMTTMAFIEDDVHRHTILSANSLGFSNLKPGVMEVMLDRRLNQDDGRGLFQGVMDNKPTLSRFRLLIEKRLSRKYDKDPKTAFPSLTAHHSSLDLIHPMFTIPSPSPLPTRLPKQTNIIPLISDMPCDTHMLNLRTMQNKDDGADRLVPRDTAALFLHRFGIDCRFPSRTLNCDLNDEKISLSTLFHEAYIRVESATATTLTMLHAKEDMDLDKQINIDAMDIQTIIVKLK